MLLVVSILPFRGSDSSNRLRGPYTRERKDGLAMNSCHTVYLRLRRQSLNLATVWRAFKPVVRNERGALQTQIWNHPLLAPKGVRTRLIEMINHQSPVKSSGSTHGIPQLSVRSEKETRRQKDFEGWGGPGVSRHAFEFLLLIHEATISPSTLAVAPLLLSFPTSAGPNVRVNRIVRLASVEDTEGSPDLGTGSSKLWRGRDI